MRLIEEITKTVARTVAATAIGLLLALGASIWGYGQLFLRGQIERMIASEIQTEQSQIAKRKDRDIA